jgi:hypothetical protein
MLIEGFGSAEIQAQRDTSSVESDYRRKGEGNISPVLDYGKGFKGSKDNSNRILYRVL